MKFDLTEAISILERTPAVVRELLSGLSAGWIEQNEGADTWSPYDIVGHLIHGEETDWVVRASMILSDGGPKTFEPFDRFAQFENSKDKTLDQLLSEFEDLRQQNITRLKAMQITTDQFDQEGIHPELGTVNLRQLLATWVVHDLGHIAQISRVMAKQYAGEVGPWYAYVPVLHIGQR